MAGSSAAAATTTRPRGDRRPRLLRITCALLRLERARLCRGTAYRLGSAGGTAAPDGRPGRMQGSYPAGPPLAAGPPSAAGPPLAAGVALAAGEPLVADA